MTATDVLRLIEFSAAIGGIAGCVGYALKRPDKWGYTVAPIVLLINVAAFTGSRTALGVLTAGQIQFYNFWGNVLMLQLVFTIIGGLIIAWKRG